MKNKGLYYLLLALLVVSCGPKKDVSKDSNNKAVSVVEQEHVSVDTRQEEMLPDGKTSNGGEVPQAKYDIVPFEVNGVSFNMVKVKGGSFTMGATAEQGNEASLEEKPTHHVSLNDFMIGQTEVTQKLWVAVMGENPSKIKNDSLPVASVTWVNCLAFLRKLNALTGKKFRLPTEAEWEFAARGGNLSKGYKYSGSDSLPEVAVCDQYASELYHKVAGLKPNELGIYDMSGNVSEWCSDWFGAYEPDSQTSPAGPKTGEVRVTRGGGGTLTATSFRVSARDGGAPERWFYHVGLRLVAPVD